MATHQVDKTPTQTDHVRAPSPTMDGLLEDLIKLHRQHLRDATESGKSESKLLVNFTMKRNTRNGMHITPDDYLRELDEYMARKMASIEDIRAKIQQISLL
jgi:hypothetical protein